jgi:hypothetical protein
MVMNSVKATPLIRAVELDAGRSILLVIFAIETSLSVHEN